LRQSVPYSQTSVELKWTVKDNYKLGSITLNKASVKLDTTVDSILALAVGSDTAFLVATDSFGNIASDTVVVIRAADTSHPVVQHAGTHDTVVLWSTPSITLTWTATSNNGLSSVLINGVTAIAGPNSTFVSNVSLAGETRDSLWISFLATSAANVTTKDSVKVRRLALVGISGAGTAYSGNQTPTANLSANLPGTRIGYSSDKINWSPYPAGGITVSKNEILYAQDTLGSVVSGIDSAAFLYIPTPTLSGITSTQATVTIAPAGSAGIEDSLSTGSSWNPYSGTFTIGGNVKVFARSRMGGAVSASQEIDFAVAPNLSPSINDTGVNSVSVSAAGQGADSVQVSLNQQKWITLSGTSSYPMTASGILYGRSRVGSAVSAVDSVFVGLYPSAPRFSVSGGAYLAPQTVSIASQPAGAVVYYTTDGSIPTNKSAIYTNSISVGKKTILKAIAANGALVNGIVDSATYFIADTNTYGIPWNSSVSYGALLDNRDGQVYRTVKIGSQTWMAQNLNFAVDSSWCYSNSVDSCGKYGRLFQWAAGLMLQASADTSLWGGTQPVGGVCPVGWHIPADSEWHSLQLHMDPAGLSDAAGLQSMAGWSGSGGGNDSVGFRALPSTFRNELDGSFSSSTSIAVWWSSTEQDATNAETRDLGAGVTNTYSFPYQKRRGLSLRCEKDP